MMTDTPRPEPAFPRLAVRLSKAIANALRIGYARKRAGRFLAAPLLAAVFVLLASGAALTDQAKYTLGPQDKLQLRVFEWRAPLDEVYEWKALNGEFLISGSGEISLPLIGVIDAGGRTTMELANTISQALMKHMKLGDPPKVALEVVEYRSFFISGSVDSPGAYPYRPGLTVLQAVSIAGGLPRMSDLGSMRLGREVIAGRGEVRQLAQQTNALLARKARLKAELARADKVSFPEELLERKDDPATARIIDQERLLFEARRTALTTQISTLKRLRKYLEEEVNSLREQVKLKQKELSTVENELGNITKLVEKGLSPSSRQFGLERLAAQLSSEKLRLETTLLKAQQEISRTDVSIDEARNKNAIEVASQLRETEADLEQTLSKYDTQEMLLYESEVTTPRLLSARRRKSEKTDPQYTIIRTVDGESREISAEESTSLQPGDTLKVELPMPDDLSTILGLPPRATQ